LLTDLVTPPDRAAEFRTAGHWLPYTLSARVLAHAAGDLASSVAVVDRLGNRTRTYADLARDAGAAAALLRAASVTAGDVVSIQLPNWYEAVVAAVAVNSIGAVVNPLLPNYRAREVGHVFSAAKPRAIFTPAVYRGFDHRALIAEVGADTGINPVHILVDESQTGGDIDLVPELARAAAADLAPGVKASAVSELIFTSGTEATPKAIMHTEETANFAVRATFSGLGLPPDAVVWMPSPVGHSTGFNYGIRAALYHGQRLVLQDRWDPEDARALVAAQGCNYTLAATTFLEDLVGACERAGQQLPTLTHFGCGGAPVPAPLVRRADAVGIRVLRLYGSTEVLCATWNRRESPLDKRCNTDGCALEHTEIEVRDDDGHPLAAPATGELHVRGPNTSVGFFADPERTAATYLTGGWVRSGDIASLDEEGYITIVGRKKEIIIRGGVNIAPREIEDMISEFPEVRQVAVVGIPDQRLGERGCACVVLGPSATLTFEEMAGRLRAAGLATYKLPESIAILEALPTTPSGKVQKHEILRQIESGSITRSTRSERTDSSVKGSRSVVEYSTRSIPGGGGLVATIALNRPHELNAISWEMIDAIDTAISEAAANEQLRCLFVTGNGRAFSAGGDLKKYAKLQRDAVCFPQFVSDLHTTFGRLRQLRIPTVALVNGVTAAGGLELLLNSDIAIAASSAKIGDGHLNFGQMGGGGVLTLLARVIGIQRAFELVMTGKFLSADVAAEWGLVSRVVPDEDLLAAGMEFAQAVASKSPLAVANAKYVMNTIWSEGLSVPAGLHLELDRNALYCLTSQDAPEGLVAFSEKRTPKFSGR
jgi:acyl-CoA synthetase (AMP-forming)/AMP-acid ligase II/enoyl-CoA hydratase/carnithine racemase